MCPLRHSDAVAERPICTRWGHLPYSRLNQEAFVEDTPVRLVCDPARSLEHAPLSATKKQPASFFIGKFDIPAQEERGAEGTNAPTVVLALSGSGQRWYRYNSKTLQLATAKGMIELYGSSFEREYARWEGVAGFSIGVRLTREAVNRLAPHLTSFDLQTRHCVWDSRIEWIVRELFEENRRGTPNGFLYSDGLSLALLGTLRSILDQNVGSGTWHVGFRKPQAYLRFCGGKTRGKLERYGDCKSSWARGSPLHRTLQANIR